MNILSWSNNALSIKPRFLKKKFIVYVEGKYDVPFWTHRFSCVIEPDEFEIQPICRENDSFGGGKNELKRLIDRLQDGDVKNTIVAADRDYSDFLTDGIISNKKIVYTSGYSFENSIYCTNVLNEFLRLRLCDNSIDENKFLQSWFDLELKKLIPVIALDILNEKHHSGFEILKNGKFLFLLKNNGKSHIVSEEKIKLFLENHADSFDKKEVSEMIKELKRKNLIHIIRGHALTDMIRNALGYCIRKHNGNGNLSDIETFELFVQRCKMQCKCEDARYFLSAIKTAVSSL